MSLRLRAATRADSEPARELISQVLAEYGLQLSSDGSDSDLDDLVASYADAGGCFDLLVDDEDRLVGTVGLLPLSETQLELRKMYLHPAARGQGHGRRLLEHALNWARQHGYRELCLETASALTEAIALYRAYGFERYTPPHLARRCDQGYRLTL